MIIIKKEDCKIYVNLLQYAVERSEYSCIITEDSEIMNRAKEKKQNLILYIIDMVSLLISYFLAGCVWILIYKKMNDLSMLEKLLRQEFTTLLVSYIIIVFVFNTNSLFMKRSKFGEFQYSLRINIWFAAMFGVWLFLKGGESSIPRGLYLLTPVLNVFMMFLFRIMLKYYMVSVLKIRKKTDKVILVTSSDRAHQVLKDTKIQYHWQSKIEGIVLVDKYEEDMEIDGVPVVAKYDNLFTYCKREIVDEVLISIAYEDSNSMKKMVSTLEDMGVVVHLNISKLDGFNEFNKTLGMFGDIPVITFANVFHDDNRLMIKRLIDIVGAVIGLVITALVTVIVAPILLIESPGPLFFKQRRVGKNGRYFYMYKFRSMYRDAEERKKELMDKNEMNGLMFKMTDDPRITKVGKFIRKTSIDELPQFFNVLKGDMSLVGTRPPTVDEFKQYDVHHKRRLSMKPGITGLWQVSGRSDIEDFEDVVKLDLEYIDNWCLALDIKILVKTVGVIFFGKGAK